MTDQTVTPFVFEREATVRVIERDGLPWFVAADVCRALGITNVSQAIGYLDDDEKGICSTYTKRGNRETSIVSESGLFTLILRCRDAVKPGTLPHRFRRWVTGEVLPALRRAGQGMPVRPLDGGGGNGGGAPPEAVALQIVRVALRVWGIRAARESWIVTGLPIVPAMRIVPPQDDLFDAAARHPPHVEIRPDGNLSH